MPDDHDIPIDENPSGPYTVYAAGEIFTQHDLAVNVFIKEALWRLSRGKYQLILPQSKELRNLDRPDIEAYTRNVDLMHVMMADMCLARFDGLELDSGTVVEFMMAKSLGKPTVILRSDSRRASGKSMDGPYNLMVKNWPRTVEVRIDALMAYIDLFDEVYRADGDTDAFHAVMQAELAVAQKGIRDLAAKILGGLDAALKLESPYPPEYREIVYKAMRYSPGSGFDRLVTEDVLAEIIQRLRENGTL